MVRQAHNVLPLSPYNNNKILLCNRPQQQSPVGSIVSSGTQQRSMYLQSGQIQPSNAQTQNQQQLVGSHITQGNYSASQTSSLPHQHQNQHPSKYIVQQQPQHNRPPLPSTASNMDQILSHPAGLTQPNHIITNATSRTSISSGGNASTAHSIGAGSIGGGGGSGSQSASSPGGKQEQRLTHEQVNKI